MGRSEQRGLICDRQVTKRCQLERVGDAFYRKQSLRKVPKSKFVNKGDICVNLKLDSTDQTMNLTLGSSSQDCRKLEGRAFQG